mmetsp:Transcript_11216/g.37047  ORF Transcript_11216/g.37047 Transcript_11216/m.37047 type:complete len:330 (-) Transcript_11216:44-1033(-)
MVGKQMRKENRAKVKAMVEDFYTKNPKTAEFKGTAKEEAMKLYMALMKEDTGKEVTQKQADMVVENMARQCREVVIAPQKTNNNLLRKAEGELNAYSKVEKAKYSAKWNPVTNPRRAADREALRDQHEEAYYLENPGAARANKISESDAVAKSKEFFNNKHFFNDHYPDRPDLHGQSILDAASDEFISFHAISTTLPPEKKDKETFAWNTDKRQKERQSKGKKRLLPATETRRPVFPGIRAHDHFEAYEIYRDVVEANAVLVEHTTQKIFDHLPWGTVLWRRAGSGKKGSQIPGRVAYAYIVICVDPSKLPPPDSERIKKRQKPSPLED